MPGNYIWVVLTAMAFGTMEIALKLGGGAFSALQMTFLRFLIGGLFLLPFAVRDLRRRGVRPDGRDVAGMFLLGFVNIVVSMTLFQLAVMHSNVTLAAVLISLNPVFTMIFAHFIVGEHFSAAKALVLAVCTVGLLFVVNPAHMASGNSVAGVLMGLGASVSFGLYTALSRRYVPKLGGMAVNSFSFLAGSAMELAVLALSGGEVIPEILAGTLPVLAYASIVVTGFGYFCFMRAVGTLGASSASYAFFIKPVVAMVLAAAVFSEPITWNIIFGMALILGAFVYNVGAGGRGHGTPVGGRGVRHIA